MSSNLPEADLSCPVCCDIFRDPVLLSCSHSFCRGCLQRCWEVSRTRDCPVCRRRASRKSPPRNLALKNLCEAFLQGRREAAAPVAGVGAVCSLHGQALKLFCTDDQLPICPSCQASNVHKEHHCRPAEAVARDHKDKLRAVLQKLKDKLETFSKLRVTAAVTLDHIKCQAQLTEKRIRAQFLELHQFLREEEEARVSTLKEEETQKVLALKERDRDLMGRTASLVDAIGRTEREMATADATLLQNFRCTMERAQKSLLDPEGFCGSLIDEAKHLSNLKFHVWVKMQGIAPYSAVTLNPNTAHPCLSLSDDLTCVRYTSPSEPPLRHPPSNPERFRFSAEVLGSSPMDGAAHTWEVELNGSEDWIVGVASASVRRDAEVAARPENGFWTLCLRDGAYRAMTSPPRVLAVDRRLQRLTVRLDWEAGLVSFSRSSDGRVLHVFTSTFTEKVLPYFYTQSDRFLKIVPKPVVISVKENQPLDP
ncbi:E3 ubiquitin-protein ligase TRIM35 [Brachyhypopomus gauderio]|uniref:E3 ubiquitin-protein ligase TRIM35 n=1 Tax=Brachyhypopomus gauderio TaxID=698409 RepID=UPI0040435249